MVVAVPAISYRSLAESLLVQHAIVERIIMLTRNIKNFADLRAFDHLHSRIELRSFRVLRDVSGVDHEVRRLHPHRDNIDLVDSLLQRSRHIRIRPLVESNMTIANLDEREVLRLIRSSSTD